MTMKRKMGGELELQDSGEVSSCKEVSDQRCLAQPLLTYSLADEFLSEMLGAQSIAPKAKRRRRDGQASPSLEVARLDDETNGDAVRTPVPGSKNVDDLLPVGVSPDLSLRPHFLTSR